MATQAQLVSGYRSMDGEGELARSTELFVPREDGGNGPGERGRGGGRTVADVVHGEKKMKTMAGHTIKDVDAAWYVFDNLSCDQAEDLLRRHGDEGSYLVSHFHDPESYGLSIRLSEGGVEVYKHYSICIKEGNFQLENAQEPFKTIEQVVTYVQERMKPTKLVPIFHRYNCETCDYSISMSADEPPTYTQAKSYPEAAKKALPLIVPIRPTLRRMMGGDVPEERFAGFEDEETGGRAPPRDEQQPHGCCWKAFHTDPAGAWYKPHKAGPVTAILLIIGWTLFLIFCGWIVALAMILVFILIGFAYVFNFICTGRCQIEEDEN